MKFKQTPLEGLMVIELDPIGDERGHFARCYCEEEFREAGLDFRIVQRNQSFNHRRGTVRGMHWQESPYQESKLVSCSFGRIFDVAVDVRKESPTYLQWFGVELTDRQQNMLFVPEGFAHGYQTLTDDAMVMYSVGGSAYRPEAAAGLRYDDPAIGIEWPVEASVVSEKDRDWSLLQVHGSGPSVR